MKRSLVQSYAASLHMLIGTLSLGIAALILQIFARSKGQRNDFGPSLRLITGLVACALGLLFTTRFRYRSEIESR